MKVDRLTRSSQQPDCAVYAYDFMVDQGAFNAFVVRRPPFGFLCNGFRLHLRTAGTE